MSQTPPGPSPYDLQFDTVEPAPAPAPAMAPTPGMAPVPPMSAPPARTCAACKRPILDWYYAAGKNIICPACYQQIAGGGTGAAFVRFLKATALGIGAGIVGGLIWYLVRVLTGYQVGIVAIVVGLLVGGAVRAGSGNRGGAGYQILAIILTYLAIAVNYTPDVYKEEVKAYHEKHSSALEDASASGEIPAGMKVVFVVGALAVSLIAPFFTGIIGVLIVGFALYEAWKINSGARGIGSITGPYAVGAPPPMAGVRG